MDSYKIKNLDTGETLVFERNENGEIIIEMPVGTLEILQVEVPHHSIINGTFGNGKTVIWASKEDFEIPQSLRLAE